MFIKTFFVFVLGFFISSSKFYCANSNVLQTTDFTSSFSFFKDFTAFTPDLLSKNLTHILYNHSVGFFSPIFNHFFDFYLTFCNFSNIFSFFYMSFYDIFFIFLMSFSLWGLFQSSTVRKKLVYYLCLLGSFSF